MAKADDVGDDLTLSPDFEEGLSALQAAAAQRTPPMEEDVRVIGVDRDNVVVRVGVYPTDRYRPEYAHDEYTVYVRIPKSFPVGQGKGFATAPPLDRKDGALTNNPDWDNQFRQTVASNTDHDAVESYSHNWKHAGMNTPGDMEKFIDVADEFLSRG